VVLGEAILLAVSGEEGSVLCLIPVLYGVPAQVRGDKLSEVERVASLGENGEQEQQAAKTSGAVPASISLSILVSTSSGSGCRKLGCLGG